MGASLTLFLTDGALLGLCSAWRCPPSCRFPGWVSSTRKATSPFLYFHTSRLYLPDFAALLNNIVPLATPLLRNSNAPFVGIATLPPPLRHVDSSW